MTLSVHGDASAYVTKAEHREFSGEIVEALGRLTTEVSQLTSAVDSLIGDVRDVKKNEVLARKKLKSLPDMVATAVEEAEEITAVRVLKSELAQVKREKRNMRTIVISTVAGAGSIMIAGLILHYIFHIG